MRRTFHASTFALTLAALAASAPAAGAQTRRGAQAPRTAGNMTAKAPAQTKAPAQKPVVAESVPLPASDALLAVDLDKLFKEVVPRALAGDSARLAQVNADVDAFKARTGIDARAFERLVVGARIVRLESGAVKLDNVTAVARGRVDAAALGASIRAASKGAVAEQQYGGKTVYVTTVNDTIKIFGLARVRLKELAVVALDSDMIAMGEPEDVRAVVDAQTGKRPRADVGALLPAKGPNDIIAFGGNVPAGTLEGVETGLPGLDRAISSIQGFYGSASSTAAGIQLMTTLRAATAADAKQLFDSLDALRQIAPGLIAMAGEKGKFAKNALNTLKITTKANEVQLRLEVPQSDLTTLLRAL
ncbi:MAG TPA: hypothetical protein VM936_06945 [Pyrinomonadaceae bacterium]|nr:hypothetical protein [Pyrinomonadaceae bacterium]